MININYILNSKFKLLIISQFNFYYGYNTEVLLNIFVISTTGAKSLCANYDLIKQIMIHSIYYYKQNNILNIYIGMYYRRYLY